MSRPSIARDRLAANLTAGAVAWALAAGPLPSAPHVAIVLALQLGATTLAWRRTHAGATGAAAAALVGLGSWLALTGAVPGRPGAGLPIVVLAVMAASAFQLATILSGAAREQLRSGLVAVGCVHAGFAVLEGLVRLMLEVGTEGAPRVSGLVGYPNALAVFLVVALVLHAGRPVRRRVREPDAATVLLILGVLATGSRLALIAVFALTIGRLTGPARRRALWIVMMGGGVAAVLVVRALEGERARLALWSSGVRQAGDSWLTGSSPRPLRFDVEVDGVAAIAHHVHNEPLQVLLDVGVGGLGVMAIGACLVAAQLRWRRPVDRGFVAAGTLLVASGLVDVTLRMPAMVVTLATVLGALVTERVTSRPGVVGRPVPEAGDPRINATLAARE